MRDTDKRIKMKRKIDQKSVKSKKRANAQPGPTIKTRLVL